MAVEISRILHAGYILKNKDTAILFDPLFENPFSHNCYAYPSVEFDFNHISKLSFAAVFISHYHDDHCSFESLNLLNKNIPIYIYCLNSTLLDLIKELGFKKVYHLNIDEAVRIADFTVIPRKALDSDVDSMFHVQCEDFNILNVVDSWIDYDTIDFLSTYYKWDLILWPFQTMRELDVLSPLRAVVADKHIPIEWREQLKQLNPKAIVPSSCQFIHEEWSWYRNYYFPISYKQFEIDVKSFLPSVEVIRLDPGVTIHLNSEGINSGERLPWVQLKDQSVVDYHYDENKKPMATAEVAQCLNESVAGYTNEPRVDSINESTVSSRVDFRIVEDAFVSEFKSVEEHSVKTFLKTDPFESSFKKRVIKYCTHDLIEVYNQLSFSEENYFHFERIWQLKVFESQNQYLVFEYKIQKNKMNLISWNQNFENKNESISWTTDIPLLKLYNAIENGESLSSLYIRINDQYFSEEVESELQEVDILIDPLLMCLYTESFSYQRAQLKKILNQRN